MRTLPSFWRRHSRLMLIGDGVDWVISSEMRELAALEALIGVRVISSHWLAHAKHQAAFFGARWRLMLGDFPSIPHRVGMTWFHGKPGSGVKEFDGTYDSLVKNHERIDRIQVSHTEMRDIILNSGIDPDKVFLIPIGINLSHFSVADPTSRDDIRRRLGIPLSAVVVGSFQKDGDGWDQGLQPKMIKGPDVFLDTIEILKQRVGELFVLLSGPARGFVRAGLERIGVPYKHLYLDSYGEVAQLYHALDVYIVSSRQEGGPKAVLESMASGVPLVTTRVGQAMDLVKHGENGWMVDVEDAEALAYWTEYVVTHSDGTAHVINNGVHTAKENAYEAQVPVWRQFMKGFVRFRET